MKVTVRTEPNHNQPEKIVYVSVAFHWKSKEQLKNFGGGISDIMRRIGESVREGVKEGIYSVEGEFTDEISNIIQNHPKGMEFANPMEKNILMM